MGTSTRWKTPPVILLKTPPRMDEKEDPKSSVFVQGHMAVPFIILPYKFDPQQREAVVKRAEMMCAKSTRGISNPMNPKQPDGSTRVENGGLPGTESCESPRSFDTDNRKRKRFLGETCESPRESPRK